MLIISISTTLQRSLSSLDKNIFERTKVYRACNAKFSVRINGHLPAKVYTHTTSRCRGLWGLQINKSESDVKISVMICRQHLDKLLLGFILVVSLMPQTRLNFQTFFFVFFDLLTFPYMVWQGTVEMKHRNSI
ncbi:hypothetical protein BCR42DRAFT_395649 [Absidia repens]|uniref:Uncharacterized protein n=1 Tax=Absidia repens TaxID=90262 RepID=A0A1X2I6L1_9FUNG|nr:hypothetical protein BCR42DRAFT_395649 [Absidia repens]